jgi:hypothetical protein
MFCEKNATYNMGIFYEILSVPWTNVIDLNNAMISGCKSTNKAKPKKVTKTIATRSRRAQRERERESDVVAVVNNASSPLIPL